MFLRDVSTYESTTQPNNPEDNTYIFSVVRTLKSHCLFFAGFDHRFLVLREGRVLRAYETNVPRKIFEVTGAKIK